MISWKTYQRQWQLQETKKASNELEKLIHIDQQWKNSRKTKIYLGTHVQAESPRFQFNCRLSLKRPLLWIKLNRYILKNLKTVQSGFWYASSTTTFLLLCWTLWVWNCRYTYSQPQLPYTWRGIETHIWHVEYIFSPPFIPQKYTVITK